MTELAEFHFLRPLWLLALLPLAALIIAIRHRRRHGGAWQRVIHPALLPLLVSGSQGHRTWPAAAMLMTAALASLALAGPSWERTTVAGSRVDSALVILFDLSPSMLATDVRPDRLTRARLKTIDILNRHREGSVALVAWAGDAHVVTPLTDDANTLLALLPVLHPELMPSAGSNPELALEKGLELLMNAGHRDGDVLFVSDGFVEQAVENLQQTLRSFPEFRLSILGVGSDEGAPIPLGDGGFARDSSGGIVVARLGSTLLKRLAERNGGRYSTMTADDRDIDHLLAPIMERASGSIREQQQTLETWHDRGPWLVLALLPLAVLAFRRNLLALVLLAPLLAVPGAARADEAASQWSKLWHNRDQLAYRALEDHRPEHAAELFRDPDWRAVADYRRGDYATAAQAFAADPSATGRYNFGNALARQERLEEALQAYDEALALDPDHDDARFNRQLVEQLLDNSQQDGADQHDGDERQNGETGSGSDNADSQARQSSSAEDSQQDGSQQESSPQEDSQQEGSQQPSEDPAGADAGEAADSEAGEPEAGEHGAEKPEAGEPSSGEETQQDSSHDSPHQQPDEDRFHEEDLSADAGHGEERDGDAAGAPPREAGNFAAAAADDADTETDTMDPELAYWMRQVNDDPGGLLRRKFEYQARQQALEPRQRFELPPDRFQEERW